MQAELARRCGRAKWQNIFYTYVLYSLKDGKLYIGWTDDLKVHFNKHYRGIVTATKNRLLLRIMYYEACLNKQKAIKREKYFKTGFGRRLLKSYLNSGAVAKW